MTENDPFQKVRDLLMKNLDDPTDELMVLGLSVMLMLAANLFTEFVQVKFALVVFIISIGTASLVFFGKSGSKPLRFFSWGICSIVLFSQVIGLSTTALNLTGNTNQSSVVAVSETVSRPLESESKGIFSSVFGWYIRPVNAGQEKSGSDSASEIERLKAENARLKKNIQSGNSERSKNNIKDNYNKKNKSFFKSF